MDCIKDAAHLILSSFVTIQNWPHDYYNMVNSSNKALAQVGSTGSTGNYPIYWRAAN